MAIGLLGLLVGSLASGCRHEAQEAGSEAGDLVIEVSLADLERAVRKRVARTHPGERIESVLCEYRSGAPASCYVNLGDTCTRYDGFMRRRRLIVRERNPGVCITVDVSSGERVR